MTDDVQGFEINGKLFPFVAYEDWLNRDFVLARQLTGVSTEELFGDPMLLEQALVAVAVWRDTPEMPRDAVVRFVGELRPGDVTEVGFPQERLSPLTDGGPTSNSDSSTATSDERSEPARETSMIGSSGSPGSGTGSQG